MSLNAEAAIILENLSSMPFEQCYSLSRKLLDVPTCPGIYAIRHRTAGVLYIGQTKKLRRRFKNGHKAFFWALLDDYSPDDIGIAVEFLGLQSLRQAKALETIMIENAVPPYCDPEDEE